MPPLTRLQLNADGLLPVVVQDVRTGAVLMVAYMNREAFERTRRTGRSHFWSRSRRQLWRKGAQSGHTQRVVSMALDCDRDTILLQVEQKDGACHTGRYSCFFQPVTMAGRRVGGRSGRSTRLTASVWRPILDRIYDVILDRKRRPTRTSYVSGLLAGGHDRILKKIGEEAGELIIGSKNKKPKEIVAEIADLWFHTLVVMGYHEIAPRLIYEELTRRFGRPPRSLRRPRRGRRRSVSARRPTRSR